jgi:hypothetical protein
MSEENTHRTYAQHRIRKGKVVWTKWLHVGDGRYEVPPLPDNLKHLEPYLPQLLKLLRSRIMLDRTTLGGFDGHLQLLPPDVDPNAPQPQRPGQEQPTNEEED